MGTTVADCFLCGEEIGPDDQSEPRWDPQARRLDAHVECLFRNTVGGIEHFRAPKGHKAGSCYEGSKFTYRESGRLGMLWVQEHGT